MSSNAQIVEDFRYLAANVSPENRADYEHYLRDYASALIAPFSGPVCPPPAAQDAALTVTAPAVSVQGVGSALCPSAAVSGNPALVCASVGPLESGGTWRSNLDLNGRLVKRGLTISFHGLRYMVSKTNRGFCYCKVMSISGRVEPFALLVMYPCESVQVVAPISRKAAPPVSRVGAKGAALPLCN